MIQFPIEQDCALLNDRCNPQESSRPGSASGDAKITKMPHGFAALH